MRLLNTRTLQLESFFNDLPPYAILSHCWEAEEVILPDLDDPQKARTKKGFSKIEKSCAQAIKDDFDYIWLDTCCIDKTSSAELSEAINSMFDWYKTATKCYAYIFDVEVLQELPNSKWFTRAWTLQELLAPSWVQPNEKSGMDFFSRDWKFLGSKGGLSSTISKATGVGKEYLEGLSLAEASISMRMSWAADRKATRAEDIAYSLLGLFDVNMPLLYGEGKLKAFRRLQEEIMKISEDETLFAWESMDFSTEASSADVLAQDPKDFWEARNLVPFTSDVPVAPYSMTHRGLRIFLELMTAYDPRTKSVLDRRRWMRPLRSPVMIWSDRNHDVVWGALRCHVAHDFRNTVLIPLRRLDGHTYQRDTSTNVALIPTDRLPGRSMAEEIYIRNSRVPMLSNSLRRRYGFLIRTLPPGFTVASVIPPDFWDPKSKIIQGDKEPGVDSNWHASVRLNVAASVFGQDVALEKRVVVKRPIDVKNPFVAVEHFESRNHTSFFMRLDCKPGRRPNGDVHPWSQSFVDGELQWDHPTSLEEFHTRAPPEMGHSRLDCFTDAMGTKHYYRLRVETIRTQVFGQCMFVVDVEFTEGSNTLGVPERP